MRATLLIIVFLSLMSSFLWVNLSGSLFILGYLIWLVLVVITIGYSDTMVLFMLGAREIRSSDEQGFFEACSQQSYKLSVPMPKLYFYNGSLERAFVLQNRDKISVVLDKSLLEKADQEELHAITFELLLQVKKGMAPKRTKSMFVLGFMSWMIHSVFGLLLALIHVKDISRAVDWFFNFLINPTLDVMFKLIVGRGYYRKLQALISDYPYEKSLLEKVGLKLRNPHPYQSLPSRKLLEMSSLYKSRHFQSVMALEFLPHEWDYLFTTSGLNRAK
jgi:hypothetical protein